MKNKAVEYYKNGLSCSESIIKAAIDEGLCDKSFLPASTAFSAGMSSGCLCGAIAASQMVLGYNFGRENTKGEEVTARAKAKEFIAEFLKSHKATCCRVLSAGLEGSERKENCTKLVADCAEILDAVLGVKTQV